MSMDIKWQCHELAGCGVYGAESPRHGGLRSHGSKGGQTRRVCNQGRESVDRDKKRAQGSNSEEGGRKEASPKVDGKKQPVAKDPEK